MTAVDEAAASAEPPPYGGDAACARCKYRTTGKRNPSSATAFHATPVRTAGEDALLLKPLGGRRFRWNIPGLPPGEHRMRLQWSGPDHRTLREGGSAPFTLLVR